MNKFKSIDELRSVKRRLYFRKEELEAEMKDNVKSLKHSLSLPGIIGNITGSHNPPNGENKSSPGNPIMNNVSATVLDILVNDFFLRKSSYFKRFFMSYLIRLVGPSLMHNAGPVLSNLLKKTGLMKAHNGQEENEETARYW